MGNLAQLAGCCNRDLARLFRDHQRDGVGLFGQSDRGPVSCSGRLGDRQVLSEGQHARDGGYAVFADHNCAVVQWTFGLEYGLQKVATYNGVNSATAVDVTFQRALALEYNQSAVGFDARERPVGFLFGRHGNGSARDLFQDISFE